MNHHRQRDGQGPDCYRYGQKSKIVKELQLSEEQKTKVDALQKTKREAALAEREKYEKDFVNILTDEQKAKYNEIISTFGQKKCPKEQTPEVEE